MSARGGPPHLDARRMAPSGPLKPSPRPLDPVVPPSGLLRHGHAVTAPQESRVVTLQTCPARRKAAQQREVALPIFALLAISLAACGIGDRPIASCEAFGHWWGASSVRGAVSSIQADLDWSVFRREASQPDPSRPELTAITAELLELSTNGMDDGERLAEVVAQFSAICQAEGTDVFAAAESRGADMAALETVIGRLPRSGPDQSQADIDCSNVRGPIAVSPGDPYHLDADGDGIGCE